MRICGLNKTTLLDYPEHVAATIFLGGCNFRCPFCHNKDLVFLEENQPVIGKEEILSFLKKRKGVLTGVCITGGEPTLEPELRVLTQDIKELGYLVKLDTNGYRPKVIKELLDMGLLDYIAMDIKNSLKEYGKSVGIAGVDTDRIKESIHCIMNSGISYEFRTTVVKELHTVGRMLAIGKQIEGARAYFLQPYRESEGVIAPGFHAYDKGEMEELAELIRAYVPDTELRGME